MKLTEQLHRLLESQDMIGYKVMKTNGVQVIAGRDSRLSFSLKKGLKVNFPGIGIFVAPSKQYVLDYYSGLADNEVLLTFKFKKGDIVSGNSEDKEPELSLRQATLVGWEFLDGLEESNSVVINANTLQTTLPYVKHKYEIEDLLKFMGNPDKIRIFSRKIDAGAYRKAADSWNTTRPTMQRVIGTSDKDDYYAAGKLAGRVIWAQPPWGGNKDIPGALLVPIPKRIN